MYSSCIEYVVSPCAAADASRVAQVSVRKAALGVMAALLRAFPDQATLAQLWVTSALPMARDVEASLQEQLLDHVYTFLMVPAGLVCLLPQIPCIVPYKLNCISQIELTDSEIL